MIEICTRGRVYKGIISLPQFSCVLLPQKVPSEANYFSRSCAVFYRNLASYQQLVKDTDAIDWDQEFLLQGKTSGFWHPRTQNFQNQRDTPYKGTKMNSKSGYIDIYTISVFKCVFKHTKYILKLLLI